MTLASATRSAASNFSFAAKLAFLLSLFCLDIERFGYEYLRGCKIHEKFSRKYVNKRRTTGQVNYFDIKKKRNKLVKSN